MARICQNGVCVYIKDQLISVSPPRSMPIIVTVNTSWGTDPTPRIESFQFVEGASINVGDGTNPAANDIDQTELANLFATGELNKLDLISANLVVGADGN